MQRGEFMVIQWKKLLICIAIPLGVGGLSALLTAGNMALFEEVNKPPLSPPGWLFPVVWTILYVLMGIGAALVYNRKEFKPEAVKRALIIYAVNLFLNFFWSIIFFNLQAFGFALLWLAALWVLIVMMINSFHKVDRLAALLQIPYLLWVSFAAYLNFGVWRLNR